MFTQNKFLVCIIVIVDIFSCVIAYPPAEVGAVKEKKSSDSRDGRLFLIPMIRIVNRVCGPVDNRGTCYKANECTSRGGTAIPGISCGSGFGVCCQIMVSCNADIRRVTTSENVVTLASAMGATSCSFTVTKSAPDVCQLQVDLTEFSLERPDLRRGDCRQAYMLISKSTTVNAFKLCGNQGGRRLYLSFEPGAGSVIDFDFRLLMNNAHKVRVTQIKCSDRVVPDSCLEYYDQSRGDMVTSFGHPDYMINNPIYQICVESSSSTSDITWDNCPVPAPGTNDNTFRLSPWFANMDGTVQVPISGSQNCPDGGTTYVDIVGEARHCGARLKILPNGPGFTSSVKPFALAVRVVEDRLANLQGSYHFDYLPMASGVIPPICTAFSAASMTNVSAFSSTVMCMPFPTDVTMTRYCDCQTVAMPVGTDPPSVPTPTRTGFCLIYSLN